MKPNYGSGKRPLVEYYYLEKSFDLRGSGSGNKPSLRAGYAQMKREATDSFIREAILFAFIAIAVIICLAYTSDALLTVLHAIARQGLSRI